MSAQHTPGLGCGNLDGAFECVCGQCRVQADCVVCGKPHAEHGSYPTCATHPHTGDGRCGAVGTFSHGVFTGLPCPGAECINGCARRATLAKATGSAA
jgi:hypothetical protein